jgi:microcystin-dependent protein
MPIGAGTLYGVGSTGGSKDAIVVSHSHGINDSGHTHTGQVITTLGGGGGLEEGAGAPNYQFTNSIATATTGITIQSAGTSGTDANLPPYVGIQFIIKT